MDHNLSKLKKKMDAKRRQRKVKKVPEKPRTRLYGEGYPMWGMKHDEEREDTVYSFDEAKGIKAPQQDTEPFFRKDAFMMQVLASICLFLIIGILFQTSSPALEGARNYIRTSFQEEFQFDQVALWYEDLFGRPLALVPTQMETVAPGDMEEEFQDQFALPATGTIKETFDENGRGIFVETNVNESVEAVRSGIVRFIGEDEENDLGKIVIVRHYDGSESWYGMLESIHVNLYDHVDGGEILAQVSTQETNENIGVYYFALKEGDSFVDPIEVISLD